ncbi:MAG: trypsin-like serine peptidase, partial [Oligoflexus sp.]
PEQQLIVPVKRLVYSTMRGLDLAILELGKSVGELRALGLQPLSLATKSPRPGDPVRIIGIPEEVPEGQKQFLREHRCREGRRTDVIEWNWYWFDMHANRCADVANGSSGSPLLDADQGVFALINTTTHGSQGSACALGQPCEVTAQGVQPRTATNYAVNVTGLERCWKKSAWNFRAKDCPLPEALPFTIELSSPIAFSAKTQARNWLIEVGAGAEEMVWQQAGRAELMRCRDKKAYGNPKSLRKLSKVPIVGEEGVYLNCLWPERSSERLPLVLVTHVDLTPPQGDIKPEITVFPDSVSLMLEAKPPEWSSFRYALGRAGRLDCRKVSLKSLPPRALRISKKEVPASFCVQGFDQAGNASGILQFHIAADGRLER